MVLIYRLADFSLYSSDKQSGLVDAILKDAVLNVAPVPFGNVSSPTGNVGLDQEELGYPADINEEEDVVSGLFNLFRRIPDYDFV